MFYTIYKTTNLINGKYYIGKHQTLNIDDNYLGSGVALSKAIAKYGKEHFIKEILFVFDNELDMNNKEKEIVTEALVLSKDNYNTGVGGKGGPQFKGKKHSEETRKIMKEKRASQQPLSEESRNKISEANRKRIVSDVTKQKISEKASLRWSDQSNIIYSDEYRQNHSNKMKKYYQDHPEVIETRSKQKKEYYKEHSVSDETKQKLRDINLGKVLSEEHKNKIRESNTKVKRDWISIQFDYNNGMSKDEIYVKYNISYFALRRAIKAGLFKDQNS